MHTYTMVAIPRETNAIAPVPMAEPIPPNANTQDTVCPMNLNFLKRPTALLNAQHVHTSQVLFVGT